MPAVGNHSLGARLGHNGYVVDYDPEVFACVVGCVFIEHYLYLAHAVGKARREVDCFAVGRYALYVEVAESLPLVTYEHGEFEFAEARLACRVAGKEREVAYGSVEEGRHKSLALGIEHNAGAVAGAFVRHVLGCSCGVCESPALGESGLVGVDMAAVGGEVEIFKVHYGRSLCRVALIHSEQVAFGFVGRFPVGGESVGGEIGGSCCHGRRYGGLHGGDGNVVDQHLLFEHGPLYEAVLEPAFGE